MEKLRLFIEGQGGDPRVIGDYSLFPQAGCSLDVFAPEGGARIDSGLDAGAAGLASEGGFVAAIDARAIGLASQHSGAGRETKEDVIDLAAGILLDKKVGDAVKPGERLATVFSGSREKAEKAAAAVAAAYRLSGTAPEKAALIKGVIE